MLASKRQMIASSHPRAGTAHATRAIVPVSPPARASARQQRSNGNVVVVVAAARVAPATVALRRRGAFTSSPLPARQLRASVRVRSSSARSRSSAVVVQANLFARMSRLIKAAVDGFLGTFEDPERLLDRVVDEMTQDVARMRQAAAQAIASERQMQARAQNTQAAADQWLRRAELAVAAGQDGLAREALTRRKAIQGDADRLQQQAAAQKAACDQLQGSVRALEGKISEARNKKETLKARAASAKSSMAINEMIGGLKSAGQNSFAAFSKMEEKVLALEAEAQSTAALVAPDALEARFAQLEGGGVEDELLALKASVSSSSGSARLSSGAGAATLPRPRVEDVLVRVAPADSAIERELDELRRRARA